MGASPGFTLDCTWKLARYTVRWFLLGFLLIIKLEGIVLNYREEIQMKTMEKSVMV